MGRLMGLRIAVLATMQMAATSFAEVKHVYHDSDGHFSFTLPAGWVQIPASVVDSVGKVLGITEKYDLAFQEQSSGYFTYPYVLTQIRRSGRLPESEIRQLLASGAFKKTMAEGYEEAIKEGALPTFLKNAQLGEMLYDQTHNAIILKSEADIVGIGRVVSVSTMMLSDYGVVSMIFNTTKDDLGSDLADYDQIVTSFKFDKGYGYTLSLQERIERALRLDKLPIPRFVISVVVALLVSAAVFGMRLAIWRGDVPPTISKLRWPIAIVCAITLIVAEAYLGINVLSSAVINGLVLIAIANALRNDRGDADDVQANKGQKMQARP